MLVLTRSTNQSIMIGPDVVVTVLEVRGDNVRLGITAPRSVAVYREEVIAQLEAANRDASSPAADALDQLRTLSAPSAPSAPAPAPPDVSE
jgi:carbon storage regulator